MKLLQNIRHSLTQFLPKRLKNYLKFIHDKIFRFIYLFYYASVQNNYKKKLKEIKNKRKIKVVFFVIQESVWKCDEIFNLLLNDDLFEPIIVIAPYMIRTKEIMQRDMEQAFNYFKNKGYQTIKTFNHATKTWVDVKNDIKPDIVFFTNPYNGLTKKEYYIYNWLDCLTCYVPYFYGTTSYAERFYNNPLQNLVWKYFCDSESQKQVISQIADSRGKNLHVSGYPGFDSLIKTKEIINSRPKIIWSPHHSIDGFTQEGVKQSCFLQIAEFMKSLPKRYRNIDFIFKPHPLLINHLYLHSDWGQNKTDNYYSFWKQSLPNTQLELGDYTELFKTSDAMIHDCGSFRFEYLMENKPCLYCLKNTSVLDDVDEATKIMFEECYYIANTHNDIIEFIENVIIKHEDKKEKSRTQYINHHLLPPNGISASKNIYNFLKDTLTN